MLIRAIADELVYNEQRNEVVFVKDLDELGDRSLDGGLRIARIITPFPSSAPHCPPSLCSMNIRCRFARR